MLNRLNIGIEKCLIIIFMLGMTSAEIGYKCNTPNNKKGVCIFIKDCTILLNLLEKHPKNITYIKASFCGSESGNTKVCCPPVPIILPPQNTCGKRNSTGYKIVGGRQAELKCITPNNENGVCITIYDCPLLLTLIGKHFDVPPIAAYIQKSICGFEGKIAFVCCPSELPILPPQNTCGKRNITRSKIVGGRSAELGEWPWMVALGYRDISSNNRNSPLQWNCGGSLISRRHVLTAAHCVKYRQNNFNLTTVRLGELDLNNTVEDGASPLDIPIELVIPHEKFNAYDIASDIALVKLQYSVIYNEFIQPICLPTTEKMKNKKMENSLLTVAGWGSAGSYSRPTALMNVDVPIMKYSSCKQVHKYGIDDKILCAGTKKGGKDSCQGDSGGPLMWNEKSQIFVMGIVSNGPIICGEAGIPGIYTRVPSYIDWIVKKVMEN